MPSSKQPPSPPRGRAGGDGASGDRRPRIGMVRVSGAADAFNRVYVPNPIGRQSGGNQEGGLSDEQTLEAVEVSESTTTGSQQNSEQPMTALGDKKDKSTGNDDRGKGAHPVEPLSMERVPDSPSGIFTVPGSGLHMPPEVLGHSCSTQDEPVQHPRRPKALADLNIQARKRSSRAIKSSKSQAAAAAAAELVSFIAPYERRSVRSDSRQQQPTEFGASMFTMMTYRGMEVAFIMAGRQLVGVCSRTQMLFQTLDLASTESPVVSLTSNPWSGMLVVAHQNGVIQTYAPFENEWVDPESSSESKEKTISPASCFGRFRWVNGERIDTHEIFYQQGEKANFQDRRTAPAGELVDVTISCDQKILVAHRNQLALLDAMPLDLVEEAGEKTNDASDVGKLLWTVLLPSKIAMAKLSGDGQAIAVVLADEENIDKSDADHTWGVRTFVHDSEDGSDPIRRPRLERNLSVGLLYKPGPFLKHAAPVTRMAFRGLGHVTSNAGAGAEEDQGNDLLMTQCLQDSTVRIFNQNGWKQLMSWTTPPNSRADWIHGTSAFSLGDLESQKKMRSGSKPPSRHASAASLPELAKDTPVVNPPFLGTRGMASHPAPTTAAGAWIAELTFRNAFPALRLSRLSYMKRGSDESQPAHFESVAAILPAGSIIQASVLNSDDMGLSIQGVWPAWNPWLSETTDAGSADTLHGSAMTFLGLSSVPPPSTGYFGESSLLGGTHSPPTELRVAASHPLSGKMVLMEFPLWGDEEFGAMELGSPLRSVLSVADAASTAIDQDQEQNTTTPNRSHALVSMDYESSRLCARIDSGARSIALSWRKQGTMSLYSPSWQVEEGIPRLENHDLAEPRTADILHDISCVPIPLDLPPLRLPRGKHSGKIVAIKWWPDDSFGGPPLLIALTDSSTLILFEVPPPWCALEPAMPDFDPFGAGASACGSPQESFDGPCQDVTAGDDEEIEVMSRQEYDVMVTPHPDFGLGLRLESPMDGLPAVAGSFKKHPLNGGMLPAEKTGMIMLGDELLSVNSVSLENMTFDDIIATVRHVGAATGPGEPLCLRFRPAGPDGIGRRRRTTGSAVFHEATAITSVGTANSDGIPDTNSAKASDAGSGRRNVIGVNSKTLQKRSGHRRKDSDGISLASLLVGSFGEAQQEFGRVIAVLPNAISLLSKENCDDSDDIEAMESQNRLLVIPWSGGTGAPSAATHRGAALVIAARGHKLEAKRLELPLKSDGGKARMTDLGSVCIRGEEEDPRNEIDSVIRTIELVETVGERRCVAISDRHGCVRLVFITISEKGKLPTSNHAQEESTASDPASNHFEASFQSYKVFEVGNDARFECVLRTSGVGLLASMLVGSDGTCHSIKVWTARPDPTSAQIKAPAITVDDDFFGQDYYSTELRVESSSQNIKDSEVLDCCFLRTGCLDSFPGLAVFLRSEAVVYQRRGGSMSWKPIVRLTYPSVPGSNMSLPLVPSIDSRRLSGSSGASPRDLFPHIFPALRSAISSSFDESYYLRSDWHPEALLAHLCTEPRGPKFALKNYVKGVFLWLSQGGPESIDESKIKNFPRVIPPDVIRGKLFLSDQDMDEDDTNESAQSLMASFSGGYNKRGHYAETKDFSQLKTLQGALGNPQNFREDVSMSGKSHEFKLAMSSRGMGDEKEGGGEKLALPSLLLEMRGDELRVLWAICDLLTNPPNFQGLDTQGELAILACAIHSSLKRGAKNMLADPMPNSSSRMLHEKRFPTFLVKRHSSILENETEKLPPPCASAGCVAALMSDCQVHLLENLRAQGEKLDWETARAMRLPFWIRSDEKLREIAEEIGQKMYKDTRDILGSALFFIIAGKHRTLKNLANADGTESGKKFFKFMTDHDFTSERGRRAAEKNAFSLLRKNRYNSASAFFLLAEPPMLTYALETIVTKMEDLELAFLVARLSANRPNMLSSMGFQSGNFGSSLSGFGGGGGFAGSGFAGVDPTQRDKTSFKDWKPKLSKEAVHLLIDRGLPMAKKDTCLSALQLLWLGKKEEASHWLSGFVVDSGGLRPSFQRDIEVPRFDNASSKSKSQDRVIATTNAMINFMSGPFLLQKMNASNRITFASTLLVSSSLSRVGIENPSAVCMIQIAEQSIMDKPNPIALASGGVSSIHHISTTTGGPQSSIFDDFDTPQIGRSARVGKVSSIFSGFDGPPQSIRSNTQNGDHGSNSSKQMTGQPSSSIFDDYDAAATTRNPVQAKSVTDPTKSSIFDGFDPLPRQQVVTVTTPSGQMKSSIFDGFDAAPSVKKPTTNASPSGQMSSSIFDDFAAAPIVKKSAVAVAPSGEMTSSIFESFDVTSPSPKSTSAMNGEVGLKQAKGEEKDEKLGDREELTNHRQAPSLWLEWREDILTSAVARRLIRDVGALASRFNGDIFEPSMKSSKHRCSPLIPNNASQVLQFHCEGDILLSEIKQSLNTLCKTYKLGRGVVVDHALALLSAPYQFHRILFAVLLHLSLDRVDSAEDVVRNTSQSLIQRCLGFSFSNDEIVFSRMNAANVSSLHARRLGAYLSWQLELCLWLHRGGALPLTGTALNEAIVAVRIGLLIASWNREFECLETMIRQPPDCLVDHEAGRQLWTSLKIISCSSEGDKKLGGASSGGWEFLVDCRRAEATELLRSRPTGYFIIRPHPDDHGVFTLSFKTNLVPTTESESNVDSSEEAQTEGDRNVSKHRSSRSAGSRPVRKDDVVQHAIIRLSDSGFRCGSFGPFATLMKLLEAVSSSLPFDLRFDQPPNEGVIKEEGSTPSPNSAFIRKLSLCQEEHVASRSPLEVLMEESSMENTLNSEDSKRNGHEDSKALEKEKSDTQRRRRFGIFFELLTLSEVRKQLSCIAGARYDSIESAWADVDSVGSVTDSLDRGAEQNYASSARILRPLLTWCRIVEAGITCDLAPRLKDVCPGTAFFRVALNASDTAIEMSTTEASSGMHGGDAVIRRMIQPSSGVEFRTLRIGDGVESAMVVLFSKKDAIAWFINSGTEKSEEDALSRLSMMEKSRVIEPVDLRKLGPKAYRKTKAESKDSEALGQNIVAGKGIRYRFVDPWEVEPLDSREAETRGASLGRHRFLAFSLGKIASSCEDVFRSLGGIHLLELWSAAKGGIALTKAIASVHPPWERGVGGDLKVVDGTVSEPPAYVNSIRQHLYRNALFRRLSLPQRFLALIQVELLDLKNLTSPGGSLSLSVYALLRLKRSKSGAPLTIKARTLDSVATQPMKLGKSTGPNAPASWGSLVRFRFPLPEYTGTDGRSLDGDREALFKGPPSVLQVSVYEKKFMSDMYLGGADVKLDGLTSGGQLEEWVPLRTESDGINWFARIRLTLRFELMCMSSENDLPESVEAPSVGLRRIRQLSNVGGAHEDIKKSGSTPDLLSYFESMVY